MSAPPRVSTADDAGPRAVWEGPAGTQVATRSCRPENAPDCSSALLRSSRRTVATIASRNATPEGAAIVPAVDGGTTMGTANYIGRVGACMVALRIRNVRHTATRMSVSIGVAALVMATV